MINKFFDSPEAALADVKDGATILIGGFGNAGQPAQLIDCLIARGAKELTVVNNNAGNGDTGLAALIGAGCVKKIICSFPRQADAWHFEKRYRAGELELELVPQGTLAEKLRAGGCGIPAFFTKTGYGTLVAEGKETREFDGANYVMERSLTADVALVKAWKGDRAGNLVYRKTARNFNPLCAMAGRVTVAEVEILCEIGELDPDNIHTPGIYVHRVVHNPTPEKRIEQRTIRTA